MSNLRYTEDSLLNPIRRDEASSPGRDPFAQFASDRARVVFSNPFRRLQLKTQVFPLESNTAVRTRMTHSLEVSHIGKSLSQVIAKNLNDQNDYGFRAMSVEIAQLVETACFLHDIGNPPFGHFGEEAISDWFRFHGTKCIKSALGNLNEKEKKRSEELISDFYSFDGNCQGLRIATQLQWDRDEFSLNLTYPQLAAFIKYTRCATEPKDEAKPFTKKPGWFYSEAVIVDDIKSKLGMSKSSRHPLVYITEAADDIAYCISDLEDGMEKGILTEDSFLDFFQVEWSCAKIADEERAVIDEVILKSREVESTQCSTAKFLKFKTRLTSLLVDTAAKVFVDKHPAIVDGSFSEALLDGTDFGKNVLESLKKVAKKHLYTSPEAENLEVAGYRIICGLLTAFEPLLNCSTADMKQVLQNQKDPSARKRGLTDRLYNRIAPKYRRVYEYNVRDNKIESDLLEWFHRAHLVMDHIAGMTDRYALDSYHLMSGIRTE